ncbi:hypothetical protein Tco_0925406 [Tanacetum coccineum]|uniref:Uncharacterized protein n=1 Tax=Tanacetum coccineum TaxID=301880 RepID=A0ABQ5D840_9ASTR
MASLDRRLNPLYAIKECSSCGNLHTKDCGCSKGSLEDKILVPIPDLSQRPLKIEKICLDCGDPVHGLYCRQCALIRKTLEEVFQDTSESSNDDTNFVNQEPFVVANEQSPLCDMVGLIYAKKEKEKRIAEEQAAKDRYWKIPFATWMTSSYTIAITPKSPKRISDKRTKNQAKMDKTEHGMEKRGEAKVKSNPKSKKAKVNKSQPNGQLRKVKVKTGADTEEYLLGLPNPI